MRIYSEHGPGRRRVRARTGSGTTCAPPGWPRCSRCWSSRPGGPTTRRSPRVPGGRVTRGARRDGRALGASSTPSSATTSSTSCASPTSASPGRPTAGPRATSSTTCSSVIDLAAGDFVRWMKQLLDLAGQVADAAGDAPLRDDRPRGRPAACAAVWWPTRRSPTRSERPTSTGTSPLTRFHCFPTVSSVSRTAATTAATSARVTSPRATSGAE